MKTISRYLLTLVALFAISMGAWADGVTITLTSGQTVKTYEDATLPWTATSNMIKELLPGFNSNLYVNSDINGGDGKVTRTPNSITVTDTFSGEATVCVNYLNGANDGLTAYIIVTCAVPGSGVTISDDQTSASFDMPDDDVIFDYELVRDMEVDVNAYVGTDANTTYRHRVQKVDANTYSPVGITTDAQLIALFPVIDVIDAQNPKTLTYGTDYTVTIIDADKNEIAIGEFNFAPGTYSVKVTGKGDYDGQIASANSFVLYYGYEVYVPAHEYVTYCSTEALTLEDENAALYTITAVSNSEATLSRALTVAPATTPLLVENNSDESRTILLIPTDKQADDVTPATEFIGVLTADRDLYKNNTFDFYAFNGLDFVYVVNLVTIPVGKCFIGIQTGNLSARSITIRRSATAIGATLVNSEEVNSEEWFDLNGRKVNKPTKKGIYIKNGQKVVIK